MPPSRPLTILVLLVLALPASGGERADAALTRLARIGGVSGRLVGYSGRNREFYGIGYNPNGCVISTTTVGGVARGLLHNRNLIEDYTKGGPLLEPAGLTALDLSILMRDDAIGIHRAAGHWLGIRHMDREFPLDWKALRKLVPGRTSGR
jgi:hypothetical protein